MNALILEVARRIAIMGRTSPEVLRELERALEEKLSTLKTLSRSAIAPLYWLCACKSD